MNRAFDWLFQAQDDLQWALHTVSHNHFAQACFIAQQVAEKSLKALALSKNADQIRSHSVVTLARALGFNGDVEAAAKKLDLYYITARYPDSFAEGAPTQYFTKEQADEAITLATGIFERVSKEMHETKK